MCKAPVALGLVRCCAWLAGLHLAVPNGQGLASAEDLRRLLLLAPIGMLQPHHLVCFTCQVAAAAMEL